jgi:hypothetical protein
LQLKWRASRWRKESWCQAKQVALTFWDEAWLGLLGGLLINAPKFYDPSNPGSSYREFQTQEEINTTGQSLDQVMALDGLLAGMDVPMAPIQGLHVVNYKNLLLTLWARASLKTPPIDTDPKTLAVSLSVFRDFYTSLWTTRHGSRVIGDGKKAEFLHWAAQASNQPSADLSDRLGTVFEALFDEIERELAPVKTGNLDPHHIHLFLLQP